MPHRQVDDRIGAFAAPPDPGSAVSTDDLVERLRLLRAWAGDPSYEWIKDRVNAGWAAAGRPAADLVGKTTIVDCFRAGRRRLNPDLVAAVVAALHPDVGYATQWRQAIRVIGGRTRAAAQVRVQDRLPPDLAGFTGRAAELDRLGEALRQARPGGGAVVVCAIAGMAGAGKTQLAIHAGHLLARHRRPDRILFVNLRGFHPDPSQPPADPSAVLDGFLRQLGVPGQQIPHDLAGRAAAYRARLAGTRTLVVLDNAADEDQVRPLLPQDPGCPALVTSRRSLAGLDGARHLVLDVFTAEEAMRFLAATAPGVPMGPDPDASARIARRCGHLPLALGLITGHIGAQPGWTLTDQADRLEERHRERRVDTGVELALDQSYRHLPDGSRRLLRLLALQPGQDFAAHAAAALADADLPVTGAHLHQLSTNHLLQQSAPGRYVLHDLVRAFAAVRGTDEDPPLARRAALTRLFDHYLAAAATAMDLLYPAETEHRPSMPPPATPAPELTGPDAARAWLDAERPTLVAVAAHTANHGWHSHTTRLSSILFRYLNGGHHGDALTVHSQACLAARHAGDASGEAHALTNLGITYLWLGQYESAAEYYRQSLTLFERAGDPAGQARALGNLGNLVMRQGDHRTAAGHYERALGLYQRAGDAAGTARALSILGVVESRLGRLAAAAGHLQQAIAMHRRAGHRTGEADALNSFGATEVRLGRYDSAAGHLRRALSLYRRVGDEIGEAATLDSLGTLLVRRGSPAQAAEHFRAALSILDQMGDRDGQVWALNGLGEAAHADGRHHDAVSHHTAAHAIATEIGDRDQLARADTGLGHAHRSLGDHAQARHHYRQSLAIYTDLGMPDADEIRARIKALDG